jgi:short-subunit dehydrogenase
MHVPIEKADPALYRSLLELNVVSVLIAMQKVIPIMQQQGGGVIINISSGTSKRIIPGLGAYSSTKYALNALTLTARAELASENIRVGLMIPGIVPTNFRKNGLMSGGQDAIASRPGNPNIPMDTPEHVAEKILEAVQTEEAEVYANSIRPA